MSIERIQAVLQAQPTRARVDEARALGAQKGDTLRLAFERAAGEDVLVADERGFSLRLAGLARHVRDFVPGDVLLLRVLATAPRLELEFLGTSGGARTTGLSPATLAPADIAAMRLDQTVANRITCMLPEAGALARTWYLRVRDAGRPPGGEPARLLLPAPPGAVHESPAASVQGAIERWAVSVFAWGSLPARLRFMPVADEENEGSDGAGGTTLALRIELVLPLLGPLVVQVRCRDRELRLALLAEREEALPVLRELLPEIAASLGTGGMTLTGASVACAPLPPAPRRLTEAQAQQLAAVAAALSPGPFRALAEIVVVLLGAVLAADVSPASRRC